MSSGTLNRRTPSDNARWARVSAAFLRNGAISVTAKAVYATLTTFADPVTRTTTTNPDHPDAPSRKKLAACVGCTPETIDRAVYELERAGLVIVERRTHPDKPGLHLPNVYRLQDDNALGGEW